MEIIRGSITEIDQNGITIFARYDNIDRAILRQYREVQIGLSDGRTISMDQRRKAYALMGEIAEWVGDLPEFVKRQLKMDFVVNRMQALQKQMFSLSDCSMTLAREFIGFLIDFMLEHSVPSRTPLYELCEDIGKYVYSCLMTKKCCVCGKKGDLHHVDRIGLGGDRTTKYQIGMRVISLCPVCHGKAHTKGDSWLNDMHLVPVKLTVEIGKKYNLSKKNLGA
ncbi:MAG: putative HNHc nuclease [Bacillota bacterium]